MERSRIIREDEWLFSVRRFYSRCTSATKLAERWSASATWDDISGIWDDDFTGAVDEEGHNELHLACRDGDVAKVESIIKRNSKLCFVKDKNGGTPLHMAAMKGRLDILKLLMKACPDSVREVTASGETCLHTAVVYNKGKIVQYLLEWLASNHKYSHVINAKDHDGQTPLHLATSRRQLQIVRVFLGCNLVDVNAVNSGGITALDILYFLPHAGKIDMELDKIFRRAGSLRTKDLSDRNFEDYYSSRERYRSLNYFTKIKKQDVLLVIASLLTILTSQSLLSFSRVGPREEFVLQKQGDLIVGRWFVFFNSTTFMVSLAIILFVLHGFPLKPWPQLSVSTLFGSYMCSVMAISPSQAMPLLILSAPFLLLAATGKLYSFSDPK